MAGYSKGIVDTRKLNKNNKAKLGRGGDTEIREVDGKESHVTALEAYLIDVNGKAGEEYAKRVGAGTINPLTGMPEYDTPGSEYDSSTSTLIFEDHDDSQHTHENYANISGEYEYGVDAGPEIPNVTDPNTGREWKAPTGRQDYETLSGYNPEQLEAYLQGEFGMGADSMQYIEGFQQEPFGFIGEQQDLATARLESAYGATMGALGSQEATLGLKGKGLTAQQTALGRTTGRGYAQATGASATAASRSGLATSGTITQAYETQKKDLFQDYTAGTKDIGRERGTALEALTLGKEGAGLDFRTAEYAEQKRQLEQMYADVGSIPT